MKIPLWQADAFTSRVFSGNPAAVCMLDSWIDDQRLQSIGAENNLAETAFLVRNAEGFDIRWFTPTTEVALCGHATLASSYVIFNVLSWPEDTIRFQTRKSGQLTVTRKSGLLEMDFPSIPTFSITPPAGLNEALNIKPKEIWGTSEDLLVVLDGEMAVRGLKPDLHALEQVDCRGVIVTARGDRSDFVSRFFGPQVGIPEDPVTGSAHCVLAPYWAKILGKNTLHAFQVSKRGGELFCVNAGERVKISGSAVLYLEGSITI